jgi:acetylornithine deacetylase/succinyl-diaminopimelate desuccinylase
MNSLKEKVIKQIDHEDTLRLLRELIGIPSHRDIPEQESRIAEYIANRLEKSGIDVKLREVDKYRPNVIATIKGSGEGHSLMLNGHTDTVPVYGWKIPDPRALEIFSGEVRDGKVFGRGSADMKGGLAAMMGAMEAIKKSGVKLKGDLVFTGVVGEEGSCSIGTQEILRNGPRTDFAIVGEATKLNVSTANRGSWDFVITVQGRTAHSGEPEKGINAIVKTAKIIDALEREIVPMFKRRKHRLLGHSVMNVSKIEGGIYGDVVPDLCKLSVRIRYNTFYSREDLKEIVEGVLQRLRDEDPELDAEVTTTFRRCPWRWGEVTLVGLPSEIPEHNEIVSALRQNMKVVTGNYPKIVGSKGWADAALLVNEADIPAVMFGPGNGGAHSPSEYLEIDQLRKATEVFALTSLDICNRVKGSNN